MNKHLALLPVLLLLNFGCAHSESNTQEASVTQGSPQETITDIRWELVELMGQPVTYASKDAQKVYIQFNSGDNRVNGNDGCNAFTGAYEIKEGQRMFISKLASTRKFCMNMPTKDSLGEVLQGVDNYSVQGDDLSLNKARMAPMARFKAVRF